MLTRAYVTAATWWASARLRIGGQRGATAVEYALMLALIAAVIVGAVTVLGQSASQKFGDFGGSLAGAS